MDFSIVKTESGVPYAIVVGKSDGKVVAACNVFRSATGYYCTNLRARTREDRKELYDYIASTLKGELVPKATLSQRELEREKQNTDVNRLLSIESLLKRLVIEQINDRWITEFVEDCMADDQNSFSFSEAEEIAKKTRCNTAYVIKQLESYGLKYEGRPVPKRIRGFGSNNHDRWSGPGSSATHGGAGTDVISGFAENPAEKRR